MARSRKVEYEVASIIVLVAAGSIGVIVAGAELLIFQKNAIIKTNAQKWRKISATVSATFPIAKRCSVGSHL